MPKKDESGKEEVILLKDVKKRIIDKMEDAKTAEFVDGKTQVSLSEVELSVIIRAIVRFKGQEF